MAKLAKLRTEEFSEEAWDLLRALAVEDLRPAFGDSTFDKAMQPLQKLSLVQVAMLKCKWLFNHVPCLKKFLKLFSAVLLPDRTLATSSSSSKIAGRFQFGAVEEQQLRERGSSDMELILATVQLVKAFET